MIIHTKTICQGILLSFSLVLGSLIHTINDMNAESPILLCLLNSDRDHLDWFNRVVIASTDLRDLDHQIVVFRYLSKDGVSRGRASVKPIQKRVVCNVDKELASARFRSARVGHGQCTRTVGDFLGKLIRNATLTIAGVCLAVQSLKLRTRSRTAGTRTRTVGVLGVRASKLS